MINRDLQLIVAHDSSPTKIVQRFKGQFEEGRDGTGPISLSSPSSCHWNCQGLLLGRVLLAGSSVFPSWFTSLHPLLAGL